MKLIRIMLGIVAVIGLAGCASAPRVAVLDPVGPAPSSRTVAAGEGTLLVYTPPAQPTVDLLAEEWRWNNDFGRNEFLQVPAHSRYVVYSEDGRVVRRVASAGTPANPLPTSVSLAAGVYRVVAEAMACDGLSEKVELTAVVKPGLTTVARLGNFWTPTGRYEETKVAKLPCGRAIGWRADSADLASNP